MRKQLHIIFRLVMFCCILLFVSQEVSAQITFSVKNQTIRQTIRVIEKKADYSFFYTDKLPGLDQKISLKVDNESIDSVLEKVFKGSPISYKIESGKQVVLTLKTEQNASQKGDKKTITGVVADRRGEPLIGVTVRVEGENIGTATDIDGRFSLEAPIGAKISFSYIGYVSQSHTVNKQNIYNVSLSEDSQVLEEVVVVGYGSMKRKDITTAVSVVSTADIEERPIMTAAQAIQGKAAGIQVVQPSGMPGSGVTIRVRGATSVQASNEPLYVVDGLPSDDISNISPNDIESMQILKDASSAAIYGARAANGVVLITTKRGKIGAPQVKMSAYVGFSKLGKKIDALNTEQYKDLMKDLKAVSDVAPNIPENETRYVDWTDLFFGTGVNQNYQLSVANGTEKLQYFVSGGYSDEQGIVEKAHFNRYNFRANLDSEQTKWLKMALNFAYSHTGGQWVNESRSSLRAGSILSVVNTPPFMQKWNPYDPNEYDEQAYGARILNPLAANAADSNTNTDHINGSLGFTVDIYKGLKFKTTFGIELTNEHWDYYLDPISTSDGRGTKGRVEESFSRNFEWLFENLLTYDCSFNKHNLSILGGATQQRAQYNASWMAGFDLAESYPDIHSISAANQLDKDACGSSASAWTLASFLGRIAYNYDSRYLLTVNFRADGSSRFAPGHRWGTFPSVSAGWRISSEKFMQPLQNIVTDLKLRAGWGMNGNQGGFGNYAYMASMSASKLPVSEGNLYPGLAIRPGSAANKELTWEKTSQWNLGLDLTMFDSRLSFSVDAYYKKTTDLLLTVSLPENVVPSSVTRNDGEMVNKGMEFTVSSQNLKGNFQWNTDFNISFNRNTVDKLDGSDSMIATSGWGVSIGSDDYRAIVGKSIGQIYGYKQDGFYSFDDFTFNEETKRWIIKPGVADCSDIIATSGNWFGPGHMKLKKLTDDGSDKVTTNDRTVIGNAMPKHTGGFNINADYKGIDFGVQFNWSYGNDILNANKIDNTTYAGSKKYQNLSSDMALGKRFTTIDPETGYNIMYGEYANPARLQEINQNATIWHPLMNSTVMTDYAIEDGSFLRLSNLTIGYTLPKAWTKKFLVEKLRVYFTGYNLHCWTKYSGQDPEVDTRRSTPLTPGVDYSAYPKAHSFLFGINLTL